MYGMIEAEQSRAEQSACVQMNVHLYAIIFPWFYALYIPSWENECRLGE